MRSRSVENFLGTGLVVAMAMIVSACSKQAPVPADSSELSAVRSVKGKGKPVPSASPAATATPTPQPTATPMPTASPTPKPTSSPTPVPTSTPTPSPVGTPSPEFGPRGEVGPDVPLTAEEQTSLSKRITVTGQTSDSIQLAVNQAAQQGIPAVFLPKGIYNITKGITIPANITLLGEGSGTILMASAYNTEALFIYGDHVRITRMRIQGLATAWVSYTLGYSKGIANGVYTPPYQNTRVDHCEILGWAYGVFLIKAGSMQVDHNLIHHNQVIGLGYGAAVSQGGYLLVMDNLFHDNRDSMSSNSNGNLATNILTRETHSEFIHNKVYDESYSPNQYGGLETHGGFHGTIIVEGNHIEQVGRTGFEANSGSALVRNNYFTNIYTPVKVRIRAENGVAGTPHDIKVYGNKFGPNVATGYIYEGGINVWFDGTLVPASAGTSVMPTMIYLKPMEADGLLSWTEGTY
jgi:hypothetical protein